jgi:hypothetical protein
MALTQPTTAAQPASAAPAPGVTPAAPKPAAAAPGSLGGTSLNGAPMNPQNGIANATAQQQNNGFSGGQASGSYQMGDYQKMIDQYKSTDPAKAWGIYNTLTQNNIGGVAGGLQGSISAAWGKDEARNWVNNMDTLYGSATGFDTKTGAFSGAGNASNLSGNLAGWDPSRMNRDIALVGGGYNAEVAGRLAAQGINVQNSADAYDTKWGGYAGALGGDYSGKAGPYQGASFQGQSGSAGVQGDGKTPFGQQMDLSAAQGGQVFGQGMSQTGMAGPGSQNYQGQEQAMQGIRTKPMQVPGAPPPQPGPIMDTRADSQMMRGQATGMGGGTNYQGTEMGGGPRDPNGILPGGTGGGGSPQGMQGQLQDMRGFAQGQGGGTNYQGTEMSREGGNTGITGGMFPPQYRGDVSGMGSAMGGMGPGGGGGGYEGGGGGWSGSIPGMAGGPGYQYDIANAGGIQKDVQGADYYNKASQQAYMEQAKRTLDPQWQQAQADNESKLVNMGLSRGSEAWNREMDNLSRNKNDAYQSAINSGILNAGAEGTRMQGMDLNQGNFHNQAQNQQWSQNMGEAGLRNNAQNMRDQNSLGQYSAWSNNQLGNRAADTSAFSAYNNASLGNRGMTMNEQNQNFNMANQMRMNTYLEQDAAMNGMHPNGSPGYASYNTPGGGSSGGGGAGMQQGIQNQYDGYSSMGGGLINAAGGAYNAYTRGQIPPPNPYANGGNGYGGYQFPPGQGPGGY